MTRPELAALKAAAESARAHRLDVVSSPAASPAAILRLVAHVERMEANRQAIRAAVIACAYCNGVGSLLCLPGDVIEPCPACGGLRAALAATKEPDRG